MAGSPCFLSGYWVGVLGNKKVILGVVSRISLLLDSRVKRENDDFISNLPKPLILRYLWYMQWQEEGIIISQKPIGEKGILLSAFTPSYGIYKGFFKKAITKKVPFLQPGNVVQLTWKARLQDHLGLWTQIEAKGPSLLHHFFGKKEKLFALSSLLTLLEICLPERDPHSILYAAAGSLIETIALSSHTEWLETYLHFETTLLKEIGYGLSLDKCAVTGRKEGLLYVSPKTGCAVTEEGAGPYKDKLLPLPPFLKKPSENTTLLSELLKGFQLTTHFLHKALEHNFTALPEARVSLQNWAETLYPAL